MTSLKAISTLQRKTRFFLLLIIFLFLALPLSADDFSVAVAGGDGSYKELFLSVLSSFENVGSERVLSLKNERLEREKLISEMKRITSESKSEKWSEKKSEESDEISSLTLKVIDKDLSEYGTFLSTGDLDADEYLRSKNAIDALFYIKSESYADAERIDLYLNGSLIHSAWYSPSLMESEEEELYTLLSDLLLSESYGLYKLDITPSDAAVVVDGVMLESGKKYIILEDGAHTFSLSSYGMKSALFSYELDGSVDKLTFSLESAEPFSLFLTTYPFECDIFLNGIKAENRLIPALYTPFLITLEADRFSEYSYQERKEINHLTLYPSPAWMEDVDMLEEKKESFYKSLFYLLLSYGGYTASNALSNYYSSEMGNMAKVVFTGFSVVSLIQLIRSAYDYYSSAHLGL